MKKLILPFMILQMIVNQNIQAQNKTSDKTHNLSIDTSAAFRYNLFNSGKVTFGLKAGYTYSNLYGSELDYIFSGNKTNWLSGFHAGILVNTQMSKYFWLKHELIFSQRGAVVLLSDSINENYYSKLKTYYLDLYPSSLTFHYRGFQIYAGPYFSILSYAVIQRKDKNANMYLDRSPFGYPGNFEEEHKYLQKFDFGINAGLEYQFPLGLLIGVKYNHGLLDIYQYANSYTFDDTKLDKIKIFSRSLMFSLGYSLVRCKKRNKP